MSENPVRSASVKAAKEIWVLKNTSSVPSEIQSQMADIIESHFAPVVAAAEEAMKEKCADAVHIKAIVYKEKAQSFHEAGNSSARDTHQAVEYILYELERAIRAIPTGTALAEYCTVLEANDAELANLKAQVKALQSELFGSHNVCCNVRSHAVGAGQGCSCAAPIPKTELQELYRQAKALREALRDARFFIASRHWGELATKALLERIDAADTGELECSDQAARTDCPRPTT